MVDGFKYLGLNLDNKLSFEQHTKNIKKKESFKPISNLETQRTLCVSNPIAQDITHPLNHHFTVLPSGRRYRSLECSCACLGKSLVAIAIVALNRVTR